MRGYLMACVSGFWLAGCSESVMSDNDKGLHMLAGAAVSYYVADQTGSQVKGCAAAIGVGLLKEAYDRRHGGIVDTGDVLATGIGCTFTVAF